MAIELLEENDTGPPPLYTFASDVWAFGMTVHVRIVQLRISRVTSDVLTGVAYEGSSICKYQKRATSDD